MDSVRPFVERDVPQVADLHRRVFRRGEAGRDLDAYRTYFQDVFLDGDGQPCPLRSLVCERDQRIVGFLGVVPRRMRFDGRPILLAVCSQFAVDPAGRGQVGLRLLKQCFQGPQDLAISDEAGDDTRKIWEWCGGETVLGYSIRWIRPLRPAELGLSVLARRKSLAFLARASVADARIVDAALTTIGPARIRVSRPQGSREALDGATLASAFAGFAGLRALRPDYDARSAAWAIRRAGDRPGYARARKMVVRNGRHDIAGWFLYCLSDDRLAEVLQLAARPDAVPDLLDHLFEDAEQQGALGVCGRLDPPLLAALSEKRVLFYRGTHWTLLHSANAELRHAVHRGDAFLTRLEGEWCLRYP